MSGSLAHSPADVVRRLVIGLGHGTAPAIPPGAWPVYIGTEPSAPDDCVTVFDTEGRIVGAVQHNGEVQEYHGIQVRVRAADYATGYAKARAIAVALDTDVERDAVTVGAGSYCACSVTRTSDVVSLGLDRPQGRRQVFTFNALANVRQL